LVIFSDGTTNIPPLSDDLMRKWEGRIDSHFYSLGVAAIHAFGCDHSFFIILRPDNHIGLIADSFSPELVENYLSKII
jgi:hypothetical protein